MCDFCKRYLNTLISGYVNIMSIFALQCRLNFKEGWMVAILTKINSIHSHLSFQVCTYIFVQYTWCVAAVCWWQMFHETLKIGSKFEPLPCDFQQKNNFLFDFLPNVVNLRTELHIPRVYVLLFCCCCTFDVNWVCFRYISFETAQNVI